MREASRACDTGDRDTAARAWLRCIELDDGSDAELRGAPDLPPFRLRPHISYANQLRKCGDAAEGVKVIERALVRWPDDADAHLLLGLCYREMKDWDRAVPALRRSDEIVPSADACVFLADALRRGGHHDQVRRWLLRAITVDPKHEEAHYNLADAYERDGDIDAAIEHLREATRLDPVYAIAHARLGELVFHRALRRVPTSRDHSDFALAYEHLSRATALDADDGWSHARLATLCEFTGRHDKIEAHHLAATRLLPLVALVWSHYGHFLSLRGDDENAERLLRHAVGLEPHDAAAHYWLGQHLWYAADDLSARTELELADQLGHHRALAWLHARESECTADHNDEASAGE